MDDYLELFLYLDDLPDGKAIDIWAMKDHQHIIGVFKDCTSCLRYKGWWSITHKYAWMEMTARIPVDEVVYFNVIERDDPDWKDDDEES